jgi:hypothetical protein
MSARDPYQTAHASTSAGAGIRIAHPRIPMCTSDACCSGDKPCPTPNACVLPEPGPLFDKSPLASIAIACALALGAATVGWVVAVPYIAPVLVALLEKL